MGHKYVKEDETFNVSRNGTVPKPTQQEVSDGKFLNADGTWKAGAGGASRLQDLSDVDVSGAQDGDELCFDENQNKWVPMEPVDFSRLAYLLDVLISSAKNGQVLKYVSSDQKWENAYPHTYSTTEQVVAIWIDGKPVYEKTISVSVSSRSVRQAHGISNLKMVIDVRGIAYKNNSSIFRPIPFVYGESGSANPSWYAGVTVYATEVMIEVGDNFKSEGNQAYITIRYTKNTD